MLFSFKELLDTNFWFFLIYLYIHFFLLNLIIIINLFNPWVEFFLTHYGGLSQKISLIRLNSIHAHPYSQSKSKTPPSKEEKYIHVCFYLLSLWCGRPHQTKFLLLQSKWQESYVAYQAKATKNCDGLKDASLADRFWCIAYQGKISPYICFAGAT